MALGKGAQPTPGNPASPRVPETLRAQSVWGEPVRGQTQGVQGVTSTRLPSSQVPRHEAAPSEAPGTLHMQV